MHDVERSALTSGDSRSGRVTFALGTYAAVGGLAALLGWVLDVPLLTNWGGRVSIQPNTAIATVLAGVAVMLTAAERARLAAVSGALVEVFGFATLLEHVSGRDLGIDTLFVAARTWGLAGTLAPGRMGPLAALGWTLIGLALIARARPGRARGIVAVLGMAVGALAALPLTGYLLGAGFLYELPRLTVVSLQTATFLFAVALGLVTSVPEREPLRSLLDRTSAGLVARRALPFVVLAPLALGYLRVKGQDAGLYDTAMGTAALVLTLIGMLTAVLWWSVRAAGSRERALAAAEEARRASEAELRAVEARAVATLEGISDGFVALDGEWRFTYLNGEAQRVLSGKREPLIGRAVWDALPETVGSALGDALRRAAAERTTVEHVHHSPRVGRWFLCRIYPAQDGGVSVYFRDITEHRQAEDRAFKGEQQAAVLMSVLPGGAAFVVDRELRFLLANGEALGVAGLTPRDFVGKPLSEVLPAEQFAEYEPRYRQALAGVPFVHEHDAHGRSYLTRGVPLRDQAGQVYAALALSHDITDRKHAEIQLRDTDRRKDEFLATLAHELRNPLAPIANALEILKRPDVDEPIRRRLNDTMRRQVAHMVRLVDDLLDVSRITRNKLALRLDRVELVAVVRDAIEVCRPMVDRAGHELVVTVPPEPLLVYGDAVRLAQVVGNLLANACKYTEGHGRISVTVERDGSKAKLVVADTGIGIPAEMLSRVFDLFVQVDHSLERSQEGLGIGLALARRLVEMHGGTIGAFSDGVGRGSQFVVWLPVVPAALVTDRDARSDTARSFDAHRILVVDDNREAAESLAMLLSLDGRVTQVAFDGQEAIDKGSLFRPDAILLDIGLPKLNGYDACRAIRQRWWGQDVVIVAVTGWGQEEDQRRAREAGFDSHVVKPIDHDQLMTTLARAAAARATRRAAERSGLAAVTGPQPAD